MTMAQPAWLDKSFVQNALRQGMKNENLTVQNFEVQPATSLGDNYGSQILRVNLKISGILGTESPENNNSKEEDLQDLSVIVKAILEGNMKAIAVGFKFFDKEAIALAKVLPAINELIVKAHPDHENLWPEFYYYQGEPNNVLVMEDLNRSGFTLGSRFEGLDLDHAVFIVRSLAKFHAASLLVIKDHPEYFNLFQIPFWIPQAVDIMKMAFILPIHHLTEDVKTWPGIENGEMYSEKIKKMKERVIENTCKVWAKDDSKLNVLVHGDCWINNYLFKHDNNGKVKGVKMIDFQLMNVNSPVLDLLGIIFSSVKPEFKFTHIDFFLQTYHAVFVDTIKELNIQLEVPFEFKDVKKDFEDKYFWGLLILCTFFPFSTLPKEDLINLEDFVTNPTPNFESNYYKREMIQKTLIEGFKFFAEKGVL